MPSRTRQAVGRNVLRKEGVEKVTGVARYIDDLSFPGMLHGRTIRSAIPSGSIVDVRPHFTTPGFTIVNYWDIPGRNVVALIDDDQPCLAEREIRHFAEPIVLIAHEDRDALLAAEVQIEYHESTPNYDPQASTLSFKNVAIDKGDIERASRTPI
jgi:CO/xanthine dehydrogenase Mo-binding subunit